MHRCKFNTSPLYLLLSGVLILYLCSNFFLTLPSTFCFFLSDGFFSLFHNVLHVVSHCPCTFPRLLLPLPFLVSLDILFKHSSGVEASPMTSLHILYLYSLIAVQNNSSV